MIIQEAQFKCYSLRGVIEVYELGNQLVPSKLVHFSGHLSSKREDQ